jgi:DNA-directed RNA polymerase subunit L
VIETPPSSRALKEPHPIDIATELTVSPESPDFETELTRAADAVLHAAMTSIRRNREFSHAEEISVPEQVEISAYGADSPSDKAIRYRVDGSADDPFWVLRRADQRLSAPAQMAGASG